MKEIKIGIPGSPDGPPVPERRSKTDIVGYVLGGIFFTVTILLVAVAMIWAIFWMIQNFPTR